MAAGLQESTGASSSSSSWLVLAQSLVLGACVGAAVTYTVLSLLQHTRVTTVIVSPQVAQCFMQGGSHLPAYFKWKESLLVPVRSQKGCAACWSFSVVDMMADTLNLRSGGAWGRRLLSSQYLLSCSFGHQGCSVGGSPEDVYNLPQMTQLGVPLESAMPYQHKVGACVKLPASALRIQTVPDTGVDLCRDPALVPVPGLKQLAISSNVQNMKRALLAYGPILGTLRVHMDIYEYTGDRVYEQDRSSPFVGMHAICIVGWADARASPLGDGFDLPYWVVRSSWGSEWGLNGLGYVRMGCNEAEIESRASVCQVRVPEDLQAAVAQHDIRESAFWCHKGDCSYDPERAVAHRSAKILNIK